MVDEHSRYHGFLGTKYFASLDGLRAISVMGVIWAHTAGGGAGYFPGGHLGVELFFAISGFLITTLLLREHTKTGTINLKGFYARRSLRIFPLYYAVLLIYVGLVLFAEKGTERGQNFWGNLVYFATYTSNWFVTLPQHEAGLVGAAAAAPIFYFAWSLATEEQFYLFWPGLMKLAKSGWLAVVGMCVLLMSDVFMENVIGAGYAWRGSLAIRMVTSISTPICMGCLLAYGLNHEKTFGVMDKVLGQWWSSPLWFGGLVVASIYQQTPLLVIHVLMVGVVGACCIKPRHALKPLLVNPVAVYLGTISYGIYLLHMIVINVIRKLVPGEIGPMTKFSLALVGTVAVASVSYWCYEVWFLRMKHKWASKATAEKDRAEAVVKPEMVAA